jgi:tetratricopeptide (TPR) repeat protein
MRRTIFPFTVAVVLLTFTTALRAGLYYSGEVYSELPSQWRGFLLDQRKLRLLAAPPAAGKSEPPLRKHYRTEAEKLAKSSRQRKLSADEAADLGALLVRLGEGARAVEVLRTAQRENPKDFTLAANLGTAWQMQGDWAQAAACLEQAVLLAPPKQRPLERLHLKLVRLRARQAADAVELDDLFGLRYQTAGQLTETERKSFPKDAVAHLQQLALWLPADGRLLWQLGELAGANGDTAIAAAILEGCVTEFGMRSDKLNAHRRDFRTAAERAQQNSDPKTKHEGHAGLFKPRSSTPLARKLDRAPLPPIDPKGVNVLPWSVVSETTLDRRYRPTFTQYLKDLDGKTVTLSGYLQPLGEDADFSAFLLVEYPIGCWYCEQPEATAILLVELPEGKTFSYTRDRIKARGKLRLNATDPENFLYTIRDAEIERDE